MEDVFDYLRVGDRVSFYYEGPLKDGLRVLGKIVGIEDTKPQTCHILTKDVGTARGDVYEAVDTIVKVKHSYLANIIKIN